MRALQLPRPLLLVGIWLVMLAVAFLFIYFIESAVIPQIPWLNEHAH